MADKLIRKSNRVTIYIKDIALITGRGISSARRLYWAIMKSFDKKPGQFITFQEFSIYTGIDEEVIQDYLRN